MLLYYNGPPHNDSAAPLRPLQNHKTFLTLAHCQRELLGTQGADPGTYYPGSSLGHQSLSTRQTGLAFSWGASREERGRGVFGDSKVRL